MKNNRLVEEEQNWLRAHYEGVIVIADFGVCFNTAYLADLFGEDWSDEKEFYFIPISARKLIYKKR